MDIRGPADSHDSNGKLPQIQGNTTRIEPGATGLSSAPHATEHIAATAMTNLLEELRSIPEVRPELVAQTIAKLREGHYLTQESAEETAEAILGAIQTEDRPST